MNDGTIIILAGGASVRDQNIDVNRLHNFGFVIGINDSGILADVNCVLSMDRLWMENRWSQLEKKNTEIIMLRQSAWRKNLKNKELPNLTLFGNDHESNQLSDEPLTLNGFNSGFCGLNLAYQIRPERIFLMGFDHKRNAAGKAYWHDPYPWTPQRPGTTDGKYKDWSRKFSTAASQLASAKISVFNVNPDSALTNFPKISYQEFLQKCVN